MLAVIENKQRAAVSQVALYAPCARAREFARQFEHVDDRVRNVAFARQRRKVDEIRTVGEAMRDRARDFQRQPRLPGAARAQDRHAAVVLDRTFQALDDRAAADERRHRTRQAFATRAGRRAHAFERSDGRGAGGRVEFAPQAFGERRVDLPGGDGIAAFAVQFDRRVYRVLAQRIDSQGRLGARQRVADAVVVLAFDAHREQTLDGARAKALARGDDPVVLVARHERSGRAEGRGRCVWIGQRRREFGGVAPERQPRGPRERVTVGFDPGPAGQRRQCRLQG